MKELNIVRLLITFSPEEFSEFRKFVSSPFFNEGRNLLPVINELKKYYPSFEGKSFTKENIFQNLYPGEKYNAALMDKIFSRAAILAEKFLLQLAFNKNEFMRNILHAKEYSERKLEKHYLKKIKDTEELLEDQSAYSVEFFENKKTLEIIKSDYIMQKRDYYNSESTFLLRGEYNLLDMVNKHIYSLQDLQLFRYELNLDISESLVQRAAEYIDLDKIMKILIDMRHPYCNVVELKYHELDAMIKFNVFTAMISICVMGQRKGITEFDIESYNVHKIKVDENSYAINKNYYTSMPTYISSLTQFEKHKDTRYIDKLIERFGKNIDPEHKESVISYSYMNKYFIEGNFEKALEFSSKINYNHNLLRINARILQLKLYYELGWTEELISLLDAGQKYFTGLEIYSGEKLKMILNLIKNMKKLIKYKETKNFEKIKSMRSQIGENTAVNNKSWFLQKVSESLEKVSYE
jgi:hypothetical protein